MDKETGKIYLDGELIKTIDLIAIPAMQKVTQAFNDLGKIILEIFPELSLPESYGYYLIRRRMFKPLSKRKLLRKGKWFNKSNPRKDSMLRK